MTNSADPDQLSSKPTDLYLHCLLKPGMSCLAREGLRSLLTKLTVTLLANKYQFYGILPYKLR